jgi:hypothetical protein
LVDSRRSKTPNFGSEDSRKETLLGIDGYKWDVQHYSIGYMGLEFGVDLGKHPSVYITESITADNDFTI